MEQKFYDFKVSDYVTFHTKNGPTTGIIENFISAKSPKGCPTAIITVRTMSGRPKKYHRKLHKLREANLGDKT